MTYHQRPATYAVSSFLKKFSPLPGAEYAAIRPCEREEAEGGYKRGPRESPGPRAPTQMGRGYHAAERVQEPAELSGTGLAPVSSLAAAEAAGQVKRG